VILVMGATGQVGSKIVSHLLDHKQKVRCVARSFPKKDLFPGAEFALGDANNVSFMADAMRGCSAAFVMIPNNPQSTETRYYQNKIGEVIAEAIEEAGIKKVVNLSSIGAGLESGTGPILGLHDQEERLNEITHADIVHLRPAYFMENFLSGIPSIISMNRFFSTVPGEVPCHMIATRDIAARAAFLLMNPQFQAQNVETLLGEREINFNDAIKIIGQTIQKPDLEYVEVSDKDMKKFLVGAGMSDDSAEGILEIDSAITNGTFNTTVTRDKINTTATSFEDFARTTFLEAYRRVMSADKSQRDSQDFSRDQNL
jgi:uncharacterized protein YbjT (DUF2867 family)